MPVVRTVNASQGFDDVTTDAEIEPDGDMLVGNTLRYKSNFWTLPKVDWLLRVKRARNRRPAAGADGHEKRLDQWEKKYPYTLLERQEG